MAETFTPESLNLGEHATISIKITRVDNEPYVMLSTIVVKLSFVNSIMPLVTTTTVSIPESVPNTGIALIDLPIEYINGTTTSVFTIWVATTKVWIEDIDSYEFEEEDENEYEYEYGYRFRYEQEISQHF